MTSVPDLASVVWRKSSHSNGDGGACLEVASLAGSTPVRDSKVPEGAVLLVLSSAWECFVEAVKEGTLRER
ncbi:DUF397 domain-containing protein [Streptomyces sp. NBC_00102]|uniref:DUF397 domain-containing protein n=1 Tax=Streptomyces sp. NBC_00102 TaxID=2975652 RepID=UPI00225C2688|nr:DUF397 domain-containing protein [Streptomyces sp. NBC_00102]MCX5399084.1 DUF397 domain-containing protein [Streptomyces sp. NBC_00102]